ncbi:MAG: hypothetical protein FWD69_08095 [Polyangiaceae bacterium]|nr:hypothetical protein [Polyangiaceae bacterium]
MQTCCAPRSLHTRTWVALLLACFVAVVSGACGTADFDPQSVVDSVRLFAVSADKPYANPGDTVTLTALSTDARASKPLPLTLYWIPVVCVNPPQDLYYACFAPDAGSGAGTAQLIPTVPLTDADAGGGDATKPGGALGQIPTGVDVSSLLPQGPTFSFRMPDDAIQSHQGGTQYGLAIVFNIACAGRVRFAPLDPSAGPQQVPILCTDEAGNKLEPRDYVIGVSRVYSYAGQTNENPVINGVTLEGAPVDPVAGITLDHCTAAKNADCTAVKIDVDVPDSSWELNPNSGSENLHEQIWADYYSDRGHLENDARLLFDTRQGRIDDSGNNFRPFKDPGDGDLWIVVHDNRGGVAWTVVPVHIK